MRHVLSPPAHQSISAVLKLSRETARATRPGRLTAGLYCLVRNATWNHLIAVPRRLGNPPGHGLFGQLKRGRPPGAHRDTLAPLC